MIERPRGLLFDLGNTLLRLDAFEPEAGTERVLSFAENPGRLSAQEVCELVSELDADLVERRETSWIEISPFMVHRLVYEPHRITFDRPFHEVEREFFSAAARFSLTDGVGEVLQQLRKASLPLGVVSNSTFSSRTLSWLLEEFGLAVFFEFVMSSADYVVRKPHPAIFVAAARKLELDPPRIWFIGDSPKYDIAGARNAGMVSVLHRTAPDNRASARPDVELTSWRELGEMTVQGHPPAADRRS